MKLQNQSWRWVAYIAIAVCLFSWKIAFTRQFTILSGYETADQAYAWDHFAAAAIHHGRTLLWDPYVQSGRSLIGEMQTALFYPPKLLLYLWPFDDHGLLSPTVFHFLYLLTHIAGAWFMFSLARQTGLAHFPAFVAGVTFSLGGFLGRVPWPHQGDSAIWLPLILLPLDRALRAVRSERAAYLASAAGVALGMVVLAGGLHVAMMDVLAVCGLVGYFVWGVHLCPPRRAIVVLACTAIVAAGVGAIQLLPSMEYSPVAMRYLGASSLPAAERIPYQMLRDGLTPRALASFFMMCPFSCGFVGAAEVSPYFGILPLLLAILGVWRNWARPWVRYCAALAVLAFSFTLGGYSLLHGLLNALIPFLWMAREAGRFLYLVHFALALLAGFGVQSLLDAGAATDATATASADATVAAAPFRQPIRALGWIVALLAVILAVPAFLNKPDASEWSYLAFLNLLCAYGVLLAFTRGHRQGAMQFVMVAVILADLSATAWEYRDIKEDQRNGQDHLQALIDARPSARFLQSRPGLFRVHLDADFAPDLGDIYGIETTGGMAATTVLAYGEFLAHSPRALDVLNVAYIVRRRTGVSAGFVYEDDHWRVYENPGHLPRAWVVHRTEVEPSFEQTLKRMADPGFDPSRTAILRQPLGAAVSVGAEVTDDTIVWGRHEGGRLELRVGTSKPGVLVLSEVDYPGWIAKRDGKRVPIATVDGVLRGIEIPAGESRIELRYLPRSVAVGAAITLLTFLGMTCWGTACWWFARRKSVSQS